MVMISIILEILYMDKLAPMYKTIIPSAFRLPETIPITYNLMLKIIISYNIFLIIKISQIMVYMSFGFPVMVTTPISPILPSIIIVISPLYLSNLSFTLPTTKLNLFNIYVLDLEFEILSCYSS